jgi:hypothetical protein
LYKYSIENSKEYAIPLLFLLGFPLEGNGGVPSRNKYGYYC